MLVSLNGGLLGYDCYRVVKSMHRRYLFSSTLGRGCVSVASMARLQPLQAPSTWQSAVDSWLLHLKAAHLSPETVRTRRYPVVRFALDSNIEPSRVTQSDLESWLASRTLAAETAYEYRAGLRSFFAHYCNDSGILNPAAGLPPIYRPESVPLPCPDDAIESALSQADERLELMLCLAAEKGLRVAEISRVLGTDLIETPDGKALVVHGKGGRQRLALVDENETLLVAALEAAGDKPLFPGKVDGHLSPRWIGKLIARALAEGYSAHKLRTRFATTCYRAMPDLLALQTLMGHKSATTTQRYVLVAADTPRVMTRAAALSR